MKKRILFLLAALSFLLHFSCRQTNRDDLRGNSYIQGRVFLNDTIDAGVVPQYPVAGVKVFIAYKDSFNNYIYSVYADSNGYFLFQNLKGVAYYVYAYDSLHGIYYSGGDTVQLIAANPIQLNLYPTGLLANNSGQNGIIFTVYYDSIAVAGASIYIYNSLQAAHADVLYTGIGCIDSITTNANGKVLKTQLPVYPDTLYLRAEFAYSGSLKDTSTIIPVVVDTVGFVSQSIYLNLSSVNMFITTEDMTSGLLAGVKVFVYGSSVAWNADSAYSGAGSLSQQTSNSDGIASIPGIPASTPLYMRATIKIDTTRLTYSMPLPNPIGPVYNGIYTKTINLHQ